MQIIKSIQIALILLHICSTANTQQDEKAGKILQGFIEQTLEAPSVSLEFTILMSSLKDEVIEEFEGQLTMKGSMYKISILGTESLFDGESIYTYMPDINEVMISDPDEDGGLMANPTQLFTNYDAEFKYRLIGETNQAGTRLYELDLHPVDRDHDFHTVKLFIRSDDNFLHSAVIAGKDGNRYTFLVNSYENTRSLPDSFFSFNEADHPGVEVIDMRW